MTHLCPWYGTYIHTGSLYVGSIFSHEGENICCFELPFPCTPPPPPPIGVCFFVGVGGSGGEGHSRFVYSDIGVNLSMPLDRQGFVLGAPWLTLTNISLCLLGSLATLGLQVPVAFSGWASFWILYAQWASRSFPYLAASYVTTCSAGACLFCTSSFPASSYFCQWNTRCGQWAGPLDLYGKE